MLWLLAVPSCLNSLCPHFGCPWWVSPPVLQWWAWQCWIHFSFEWRKYRYHLQNGEKGVILLLRGVTAWLAQAVPCSSSCTLAVCCLCDPQSWEQWQPHTSQLVPIGLSADIRGYHSPQLGVWFQWFLCKFGGFRTFYTFSWNDTIRRGFPGE